MRFTLFLFVTVSMGSYVHMSSGGPEASSIACLPWSCSYFRLPLWVLGMELGPLQEQDELITT